MCETSAYRLYRAFMESNDVVCDFPFSLSSDDRWYLRFFGAAGFDWREPGCSMCLAMNDDKLAVDERAASTSNRNFEGRQGRGGRTHLVSPAMAAAAAITGHLTDVRDF